MKTLNTLIGTLLGSLGALTGVGLLATGCSDNSPHHESISVTVTDVEACCGTDKTSQNYNACVQDYQANGVCSTSGKPDDPIWDVPTYGMPDPIGPTPEQLQECCGQDDGTNDYKACVENYTDVNVPHACRDLVDEPDPPSPAIYGPNPYWCCGPEWDECSNTYFNGGGCTSGIDPSESQACCAKAENQDTCVLDFIKTKECPTEIKVPDEFEIEECCRLSDGTNDAECEKKYKETGVCDNTDMAQCCSDYPDELYDYQDWKPNPNDKYFNSTCVSILRKKKQCSAELTECCSLKDGTYNDECTRRFEKTGQCPTQLNTCCKTDTGLYDKFCFDEFSKKGQCNTEYNECCKAEDGSINLACAKILKEKKQCLNDKEILDCCSGEKEFGMKEDELDSISVSYTCIDYYKKNNVYHLCATTDDYYIPALYGSDFRPDPYKMCEDYIGDYKKCTDFAKCGTSAYLEEGIQCCGEDDKSEKFSKCIKDYEEKGKTDACTNPLDKDEPAPNTNPKECCGPYPGEYSEWEKPEEWKSWVNCKDDYLETGKCPNESGDE